MYIRLLRPLAWPLLFLMNLACSTSHESDTVLDSFSGQPINLASKQEIALDKLNILMPTSVFRYGQSLIIEKAQSKNVVDIYTPSTGQLIHCFRIGRGPQEIITPSSLQMVGDSLFLYDIPKGKDYSLNLPQTIDSGQETSSEKIIMPNVNPSSFVRPYVLLRNAGYVAATGFFPNDCWYVNIHPNGIIRDGPGYLEYSTISDFQHEAKCYYHISSLFSSSPDGEKILCASRHTAAFCICKIEGDDIQETFRYVAKREPLVKAQGKSISFDPNNLSGFISATSDNRHIYLLYSGKPIIGDTPSFLSSHVLVYDWDGRPIKRIELDKNVQPVSIHSDKLYCTTSEPEPLILIYDLTKSIQ